MNPIDRKKARLAKLRRIAELKAEIERLEEELREDGLSEDEIEEAEEDEDLEEMEDLEGGML